MAGRFADVFRRPVLAGAATFLTAVLLSATAVWFLSADARDQIDKLAIASADSSQWSLAQAEVEFQALQAAVLAAHSGLGDDLRDVRNRFDIFYSRLETVKRSASFDDVRALPNVKQSISRIERFLTDYIPVVDGSDAALQAALPRMAGELISLREELRTISIAGVKIFSVRGEGLRERVAGALRDLGLIAFFLMATLLATVAVLVLIMGSVRRKSNEVSIAQARLEAIVSTSIDAIVVAGGDGQIIRFNEAAERVFGYSQEEASRVKLCELLVFDRDPSAPREKLFGPRGKAAVEIVGQGLIQLQAKRKNGEIFPIELSMNAGSSDDGTIYVSFIRDISNRVAARRELVEARDRAVMGEKAKADLLAIMSHEMRTPLNGVLGTLELLASTSLDDRQRHYVEVMESSGQMLMEHVNNVLDISRVDAGKAKADVREFDLRVLCSEVVGSLKTAAIARGNTLDFTNPERPAGWVMGDPTRLRQVLVNLLGNAIKFTKGGRITLEVIPLRDGSAVEFRVADTGVGIPEDNLQKIFEDFVTLDATYQREVEGTGLGLGIVRRLVDVMGGEIDVESIEGEGTVFWFTLPLPAAKESESEWRVRREPVVLEGDVRILVVEDNEINRMVVRDMLEQRGAQVIEARDGKEGVAIAAKEQVDLILMDISMPRMDGVLAASEIRRSEGLNSATPIVALTAHAMPEDIARFREAGMCDVLTKPLSTDRVDAMLHQQTGRLHPVGNGVSPDGATDRSRGIAARAVGELAEGVEELGKLVDGGVPPGDIGALAHKLAGTAAVVGLGETHAALVALVEAAEGAPNADIQAELGRVRSAVAEISA